jgi:hypothetical protein
MNGEAIPGKISETKPLVFRPVRRAGRARLPSRLDRVFHPRQGDPGSQTNGEGEGARTLDL